MVYCVRVRVVSSGLVDDWGVLNDRTNQGLLGAEDKVARDAPLHASD